MQLLGVCMFLCVVFVGEGKHISHRIPGNIGYLIQQYRQHHSSHLSHSIWQYFLNHFGHSHHNVLTSGQHESHHSQSHHEPGPEVAHTPDTELMHHPTEATFGHPDNSNGENIKPHLPSGGNPSPPTDERQSFKEWKNNWLLNHLSTCGDQPIEPLFQQNRIIGGNQARKGSWPWMVSFFSRTIRQHICAGSIIDKQWIVSAAHCFVEFQLIFSRIPDIKVDLEVRAGIHNSTEETADREMQSTRADLILINPEFNMTLLDNDIALIRLTKPLNFTDYIQPVCAFGYEAKGGNTCVITGWGRRKKPVPSGGKPIIDPSAWPNVLKQAVIPVVEQARCRTLPGYETKITSHMICAGYLQGGVDACNGDSGGPLLCQGTNDGRWAITGITSWGGADYRGCAEPDQPGVYTKVSGYYNWILSTLYQHSSL